jgi:steroid delta-isomerase-like uncharacterized protein
MAVAVLDKHAIDAMLEGFFDAYNRHDIEAVVDHCTEDIRWEDPTAGVLHGKPAVRKALGTIFRAFPDMGFAKNENVYFMSFDATRAASSWRLTGTMAGVFDPPGYAPTNGPIDIRGMCLYELRDGLISHHTIVFNMIDLGRQIDALPPQGSLMDKMSVRLQRMKAGRKNR